MDEVVANALRAVAEAEQARDDAEQRLREAWAERIAAFQATGMEVVYYHEHRAEPASQRIVVVDGDTTVNVDAWTREAVG